MRTTNGVPAWRALSFTALGGKPAGGLIAYGSPSCREGCEGRHGWFGNVLRGVAALVLLSMQMPLATADGVPFAPGNVLITYTAGFGYSIPYRVRHFSPDGTLLDQLDLGTSASGYGSDIAFDAAGNLYLARGLDVRKYSKDGNFVGVHSSGYVNADTVVFDRAGYLNVGEGDTVNGLSRIFRMDASGAVVDAYSPLTDSNSGSGVSYLDLSPEVCKLRYTSDGGRAIKQFDVCSKSQLPDFVSSFHDPDWGSGYALCYDHQMRPNEEVLIACGSRIYRVDSSGAVLREYQFPGGGPYPAVILNLALDPDDQTFWLVDWADGTVFRADIATGDILSQFSAASSNTSENFLQIAVVPAADPVGSQDRYAVDPNAYPNNQGGHSSDSSGQGSAYTAEPINIGSGVETLTESDYSTSDGRLMLSRSYNSLGTSRGTLSPGWQESFLGRRLLPAVGTLPVSTRDQLFNGGHTSPEDACAAVSGTYAGMQCTLPSGRVLPVYASADLGRPADSSAALSSTALSVRRSDGGFVPFTCPLSGAATCIGNSDRPQKLARLANGSFVFTDADYTQEVFSASGSLLSVSKRGGYQQSFSYHPDTGLLTEVTDSFGRRLSFSYSAGRLQGVQTPGGFISYGYDSFQRLTEVTYPTSPVSARRYLYEDASHPFVVTGVVDENQERFASITYSSATGLAVKSTMGGFKDQGGLGVWEAAIDYADPDNPVVTDAFGVSRAYRFQTINGRRKLTAITAPNGDAALPCNTCGAGRSQTYDAAGYLQSVTDWKGNVTTYSHNSRGLQTSRTEAYGTPKARTVTTAWHSTFPVPTQIDQYSGSAVTGSPLRTTTFTYDTTGNLTTATVADNAVGRVRTWTYSNYTAQGQPGQIDGPRTDVSDLTNISYYPIAGGDPKSGQVRQIVNALGHVVVFDNYDASGRPLQVTDENGVVTQLAYTPRGWLKRLQRGSEVTNLDWWPTGRLRQISFPSGVVLNYAYNAAHQLTEVTDQLGNRIAYGKDEMGNMTALAIYDPSSTLVQTHQRVYNSLNQLWKDIGAYPGETTVLGNDQNGNLTSILDPLNRTTLASYAELNRLYEVTDAANGNTNFWHNPLDQLTAVTDPRSLSTVYTVDALDNTYGLQSPDTGDAVLSFDGAGNAKTRTDAKGQTTSYTYDALNRLTLVTRDDDTVVSFTWDQNDSAHGFGIGRLTSMSDPSGVTNWRYDNHGRVLSKAVTIGNATLTTAYQYDASTGQLLSMTLPSGKLIGYSWSNGQLTALTVDGAALVSDIRYQAFGGPKSWTLANGQSTGRSYDLNGRITADPVDSLISYDSASRITGWTLGNRSVLTGSQTAGYDALDRLTSYSGSGGPISYQYDANGNRLDQTILGIPTAYTVDPASNRITRVGSTNLSYDANGSLTADGNGTYSYDAAGRMSAASAKTTLLPLATTVVNGYNGFGERVSKRTGLSTSILLFNTQFVYDEAGRLIGEYNGITGQPVAETVYLGDMPMALLKSNGTYYIHADWRNAPRQIDDATGTAVWAWNPTPFGDSAPNEKPSGQLLPFKYNLRYPGQYHDTETGVYYNYQRSYLPGLGRYAESDPIGLMGGINTYGYVHGNPISRVDLTGLVDWVDFGFGVVDFGTSTVEATVGVLVMVGSTATGPAAPAPFYGGLIISLHGTAGMANAVLDINNALNETSGPGLFEALGGMFGETGAAVGQYVDLASGIRPSVYAAGSTDGLRELYDFLNGLHIIGNAAASEPPTDCR